MKTHKLAVLVVTLYSPDPGTDAGVDEQIAAYDDLDIEGTVQRIVEDLVESRTALEGSVVVVTSE